MSGWTYHSNEVSKGAVRYELFFESSPASYESVVQAWIEDERFREFFNRILADSNHSALRWETPAVSTRTLTRAFEFVLVDAAYLARKPEPKAFLEYFARADSDVLAFPNLGRNATMIVPRPLANDACYGHLAAFVRDAPEEQRMELWRVVGETMREQVGSSPLWLSTAGGGVSWLHVRIDESPKYYAYEPYKKPG